MGRSGGGATAWWGVWEAWDGEIVAGQAACERAGRGKDRDRIAGDGRADNGQEWLSETEHVHAWARAKIERTIVSLRHSREIAKESARL